MSLNVFVSFYIVGFFFPWFQEYCFSVIFGCFFTEKPPWRWSKMLFGGFLSHGGTPSHHQFLDRIFHETNHPAIGYLHRKPPCHRENDNKPLGFGGQPIFRQTPYHQKWIWQQGLTAWRLDPSVLGFADPEPRKWKKQRWIPHGLVDFLGK